MARPTSAGVPVGAVTQVFSQRSRGQTQRAVIDPYVDFSCSRRRRRCRPLRHDERPRRHRGRRGPAGDLAALRWSPVAAVIGRPRAPGHALPASGLARHRPQPLPAGRRRRRPHPRTPQFALVLGFAAGVAARPGPAGRPRRGPVGARPGRRRVPGRRSGAPGRPADVHSRSSAPWRRAVVRRRPRSSRSPAMACWVTRRRVWASLLQVILVAVLWDVAC
jgi:hypothetical protein